MISIWQHGLQLLHFHVTRQYFTNTIESQFYKQLQLLWSFNNQPYFVLALKITWNITMGGHTRIELCKDLAITKCGLILADFHALRSLSASHGRRKDLCREG